MLEQLNTMYIPTVSDEVSLEQRNLLLSNLLPWLDTTIVERGQHTNCLYASVKSKGK